jgi:signal transduction histidine kinase
MTSGYKLLRVTLLKSQLSYMMLLGGLSYIFRYINLDVPEHNLQNDFAELPILVSCFILHHPVYILGVLFISAFRYPEYYAFVLLIHLLPTLFSWFSFHWIVRELDAIWKKAIVAGLVGVLYYALLITSSIITPNSVVGLVEDLPFHEHFVHIAFVIRYEIMVTSVLVVLVYIQYNLIQHLRGLSNDLEKRVKERTKDLNNSLIHLRSAQNKLVQSEKMSALGTLTSGIAHELNNPLNFIMGGLQIQENIRQDLKNHAPRGAIESFNNGNFAIQEGLERAVKIVNTLILFSAGNDNKRTPFALSEIIDNVLTFIKPSMPTGISVEKNYEYTGTVFVYVDKIHQCVLHILENAVHALKKSENTTKSIRIQTKSNGHGKVRVTIGNNGPSIPEAYLSQIFEPFFTTKDPNEGTGLGLYNCYNIIELHHGELVAQNTPDGVVFIFDLPMVEGS